jgi:DNA polymerase-1
MKDKTCLLVDGNAIMYRAYYGVSKGFVPVLDGMPVGMVYGFISTILNALEFLKPHSIVVTFDTKEKTFRHKMDENYKAQRKKAPDDFYPQMPFIFDFLKAMNIQRIEMPGFESDDIIGTLALKGANDNFNIKILSGDLDFLQIVSERIKLLKLNGKIEKSIEYGPEQTKARFAIEPSQIVDLKALSGDSSDNYQGISGIGPKTAAKWLQSFQTLENIFDNLEKFEDKIKEKLETNRDYVFHCQKLAALKTDLLIDFEFDKKFEMTQAAEPFFVKMKFHSLMSRWQKLNNNFDQNKNIEQIICSGNGNQEEQMSLF